MELQHPSQTEDEFTKTIERYTAAIPSTGYLAVAIGAIGLSLVCQVTGRGKGATSSPSGCRPGSSSASITSW
jgi:hypothetical protein